MNGSAFVTEKHCNGKLEKVYARINTIDRNLAKVIGGIVVVAFVSTFFVGLVSFHINQRFSGVEKSIDKMDNRLVEYLSKQGK